MSSTINIDQSDVLSMAIETLDRGDWQTGGQLLVDAAHQMLHTLCEAHDCLPTRKDQQTALGLLKAYRKATDMNVGTFKTLSEIIAGGMRGADGRFIKPTYLKGCVELLASVLLRCAAVDEIRLAQKGGAV